MPWSKNRYPQSDEASGSTKSIFYKDTLMAQKYTFKLEKQVKKQKHLAWFFSVPPITIDLNSKKKAAKPFFGPIMLFQSHSERNSHAICIGRRKLEEKCTLVVNNP